MLDASINKAFKKMHLFYVPSFSPLGEIEFPTNKRKKPVKAIIDTIFAILIVRIKQIIYFCVYIWMIPQDIMEPHTLWLKIFKRTSDPASYFTLNKSERAPNGSEKYV